MACWLAGQPVRDFIMIPEQSNWDPGWGCAKPKLDAIQIVVPSFLEHGLVGVEFNLYGPQFTVKNV